jgi:hypothetical protein
MYDRRGCYLLWDENAVLFGDRPVNAKVFRHRFATHPSTPMTTCGSPGTAEFLRLTSTQAYAHVRNRGGHSVASPLEVIQATR